LSEIILYISQWLVRIKGGGGTGGGHDMLYTDTSTYIWLVIGIRYNG